MELVHVYQQVPAIKHLILDSLLLSTALLFVFVICIPISTINLAATLLDTAEVPAANRTGEAEQTSTSSDTAEVPAANRTGEAEQTSTSSDTAEVPAANRTGEAEQTSTSSDTAEAPAANRTGEAEQTSTSSDTAEAPAANRTGEAEQTSTSSDTAEAPAANRTGEAEQTSTSSDTAEAPAANRTGEAEQTSTSSDTAEAPAANRTGEAEQTSTSSDTAETGNLGLAAPHPSGNGIALSKTTIAIPAKLIVQTKVINNCEPRSFCEGIRDDDFVVNIFTFEGNKLRNETDPIPGDSQGWGIQLFPSKTEGIQYDVSQERTLRYHRLISINTTFSDNCHGTIEQKEIRTCVISNYIMANNMPGLLKVQTNVTNNCEPRTICDGIRDEDFLIKIFTFEDNVLSENIEPFHGDSQGWTVYFSPQEFFAGQLPPYGNGIEYEVQQEVQRKSTFEGILMKTTYSQDCRSTISQGSLKTCNITNFLSGSNS